MTRSQSFLPQEFVHAHNFAFVLHDILVELLRSGEKQGIFNTTINFENDEEGATFGQADDIFDWLAEKQLLKERADILRVVVFPAILSDLLHFFYEALDCSRKAKLNVTYALLRKPLQEDLFILESIARDPIGFSNQLASDPMRLRATKIGGSEVHKRLIEGLLGTLGLDDRYDASFLAQLRYQKCDDGFDGICNLAMHLFTEHPKIRTENLNMNFIFSDWDAKFTQWAYLYARLPYILAYIRDVVENVCQHIATTSEEYVEDMNLRVAAYSQLWWMSIPNEYKTVEIERFADFQTTVLHQYYSKRELQLPSISKLEHIAAYGHKSSLWQRILSVGFNRKTK